MDNRSPSVRSYEDTRAGSSSTRKRVKATEKQVTEHTTSMHTAVKIRPSTESNHQPGPETSKASPPSPRTLIAKANWLQCHISFSKHEGKEGHILSAAEKSLPTAATILSDEKIRKGGNK